MVCSEIDAFARTETGALTVDGIIMIDMIST